jgi:hypothetical protein
MHQKMLHGIEPNQLSFIAAAKKMLAPKVRWPQVLVEKE